MNDQELFWKGAFGDEYVDRIVGPKFVAAKVDMFIKALNVADNIGSIIELGSNRGLNANALKAILPSSHYTGVEIGDKAFSFLKQNPNVDECHHASIHGLKIDKKFDLAIIAGVMIHLNPNSLPDVYRLLASLSNRYVILSEYYNPTPVEINYRGHSGKLFKRDFAQEFIEETGFRLLDYGFLYQNDPKFHHADMTWFLLEM